MAAPASTITFTYPNNPTTDPLCHLSAASADPFIQKTLHIGWQPATAAAGAPAQMLLPSHQMIKTFGTRVKLARPVPMPASLNNVSVFSLRLSGPAWARIVKQYVTSGLLTKDISTTARLERALAELVIVTPTDLEVGAADLALLPAFSNGPTGAGAAAVARRAQMAKLRFLSLFAIKDLELGGGNAPWAVVCECARTLSNPIELVCPARTHPHGAERCGHSPSGGGPRARKPAAASSRRP
jgi:hypothetical protein